MVAKAVLFDYIGTLVECKGYSMEESRKKLHCALRSEGLDVAANEFLDAYDLAHEKYRKVRYGELREVTNAVWVSEALCSIGINVSSNDDRVKAALNVFFQDFIDTLKLRGGSKNLLSKTAAKCRVGLVSNFTYAPVIHKSLRQLGISHYFSTVVISEELGWRKPSEKIFQTALNSLNVRAEDAVFVGDSPIEDIKGAKDIGLKTVFVTSQFNTMDDLKASLQEPVYHAKNLQSVSRTLNHFFKSS